MTGDRRAAPRPPGPSLGRASGLMAVASLVSRVTGFLRQLALVSVLGLGVVNDSYTVANTLPNIVYELLLGGVLTSVMVPLLVRAQTEDADGGEAYTRRLLTVAGVALALATLVAMAAAPLLTRLYLGDGAGPANPELATAFAWLLLPQIFFYGLGALLGALLNTRGVFGPFAWAPVLNNVVVLAVLAVFVALPGRISLDPVRMGEPKLLVLGVGTTLGIVVAGARAAARRAPHRVPLPPAVGLGPAARRDRRAGPLGRRVRADRAAGLHRHHPRRGRRPRRAASRSTPTPGCCSRCPTACWASRCSPRSCRG